jgi:hypothetical protein
VAIPVLIIGASSSGKSYSVKRYNEFPQGLGIINVQSTKLLPFRAPNAKVLYSDNYNQIMDILAKCSSKSILIDDVGYLMTNHFMLHHRGGKGNEVYELYNEIADRFWNLIQFIGEALPPDKIVYFTMHEETNDYGIRPKTIGKLLNDKVCIEGMLSIVFHAVCRDGKYIFLTQNTGNDIAKSPEEMFDSTAIDNDLLFIDNSIRNYYGLVPQPNDKENNNNVPQQQ